MATPAVEDLSPTYHSNESAAYVLPNDAPEHERLNLQHNAIVATLKGQCFIAPIISSPGIQRALDIGCGTGTTTHLLASLHPSAQVHGVDLTPIPRSPSTPFNITFTTGEIRSLVQEGKVPTGEWSYVFSRMLFLGMTDWPGYIALLCDLLEPGGWAEVQEVEFLMRDAAGTIISEDWAWLNGMTASLAKKGLDMECARKLEGYMLSAGFVDVQVKVYIWSWSKESWTEHPEADEVGRYSVDVLRKDIGRMAPRLWEKDEVDEMYADLSERTTGLDAGAHMRYFVVCGRKAA